VGNTSSVCLLCAITGRFCTITLGAAGAGKGAFAERGNVGVETEAGARDTAGRRGVGTAGRRGVGASTRVGASDGCVAGGAFFIRGRVAFAVVLEAAEGSFTGGTMSEGSVGPEETAP
jgi:hypothetical protein